MEISQEQTSQIVNYLIQAADKANEVAPAIIEEYIHYSILDSIIAIIFSFVVILLLRLSTKRVNKFAESTHDEASVVGAYNVLKYIVYFISLVMLFCNISTAVGYYFYPKAVLLKEILDKIS